MSMHAVIRNEVWKDFENDAARHKTVILCCFFKLA